MISNGLREETETFGYGVGCLGLGPRIRGLPILPTREGDTSSYIGPNFELS